MLNYRITVHIICEEIDEKMEQETLSSGKGATAHQDLGALSDKRRKAPRSSLGGVQEVGQLAHARRASHTLVITFARALARVNL